MKLELESQYPPFFKLSNVQDLILYLIKEELEGAKFLKELADSGFDSKSYEVELGIVILSLMEFESLEEELWIWYHDKIDTFVPKVDLQSSSSTHEVVLDFYCELRTKRRSEVRSAP